MKNAALFAVTLIASMAYSARAQLAPVFDQSVDDLEISRAHAQWPAPESIVGDLRSTGTQTRLAALHQMGVADDFAYIDEWSDTAPSHVGGKKLVTPDEVRLTYAAIGDSADQQAIVTMYIAERQRVYAAIATLASGRWQRIGMLTYWCKYDLPQDVLSQFLQLQPAPYWGGDLPARFELVTHASGGGSGVYGQTETRFRVYHGELVQVFSFNSRYRLCSPGVSPPGCMITRGWFYLIPVGNSLGGLLVKATGKFPANKMLPAYRDVDDMEIGWLQHFQCTTYKWDEQTFGYTKLPRAPDPCVIPPH
jgi:hypothetical protein